MEATLVHGWGTREKRGVEPLMLVGRETGGTSLKRQVSDDSAHHMSSRSASLPQLS